jgi:hypothetical protein
MEVKMMEKKEPKTINKVESKLSLSNTFEKNRLAQMKELTTYIITLNEIVESLIEFEENLSLDNGLDISIVKENTFKDKRRIETRLSTILEEIIVDDDPYSDYHVKKVHKAILDNFGEIVRPRIRELIERYKTDIELQKQDLKDLADGLTINLG